jgi:hypothetical protein
LPNHKKVIPFKRPQPSEDSPAPWKFSDYAGGYDIEAWYGTLSEDAQDIFNSLLKINANIPIPLHWQGAKFLQGKYKQGGIWEWRFFADERQQRLLGIFGEERRRVIFLVGCSHKDSNYTPTDCLNIALKRAKQVRQNKAKLNEHTIPTDI